MVAVDLPAGQRADAGARAVGERPRHAPRIAALDGMRGVAVAAVVAFHLDAPWLRGGFLGVDLFFVVSGFVITRLLVDGRDAGHADLRSFWERRARRLLPQVLLVVGAVAAWAAATDPLVAETVRAQGFASLVYGSNWYNIVADVGYWDAGLAASPLNHLWSLAIEEQFYVVWPLVVLLVVRRAGVAWRSRLRTVAAVGALASFAAQFLLAREVGVDRAYLGTEARVGAILVGALISLLLPGDGTRTGTPWRRSPRSPAAVLGWLAVGGLAALWVVADVSGAWLYRGPLVGASLLAGVLVWSVVVRPGSVLARGLGTAPLVGLGRRSYAIYVWHYPVLTILDEELVGAGGAALLAARLGATAVLAEATLRIVEDPVRRATRLTGRRLLLASGVAILAVVALLLQVRPVVADDLESTAPIVDVGAVDGATVMIVGDSWSRNLGIGLQEEAGGRATIVNLGVGGCGIADPESYRTSDRGDFPLPDGCRGWAERWTSAAAAYRPDAVIVQVGNWDQALQQVDGAWTRPCDAAFDRRYAGKLDQAIEAAGSSGAVVFLTNVRDGPDAARPLSDCINASIDEAAARHPDVVPLDLRSLLCPDGRGCPDEMDGEPVYDETGHLAPPWQRRAARWALAAVSEHLPEDRAPVEDGAGPASGPGRALPTAADVVAMGGPRLEVPEAAAATDALAYLAPGVEVGGPAARRRGLLALTPEASVVAASVVAERDETADALALAALERFDEVAPGPRQAYLSADTLTRVLVRDGDDPALLVVVRKFQGVVVVEARGFEPAPDADLAAAAEVLVGRFARVETPG